MENFISHKANREKEGTFCLLCSLSSARNSDLPFRFLYPVPMDVRRLASKRSDKQKTGTGRTDCLKKPGKAALAGLTLNKKPFQDRLETACFLIKNLFSAAGRRVFYRIAVMLADPFTNIARGCFNGINIGIGRHGSILNIGNTKS